MAKKRKRKPVRPKICPRCGQEFYTFFAHLDRCRFGPQIVAEVRKRVRKLKPRDTTWTYLKK